MKAFIILIHRFFEVGFNQVLKVYIDNDNIFKFYYLSLDYLPCINSIPRNVLVLMAMLESIGGFVQYAECATVYKSSVKKPFVIIDIL